LLGEMGGIEMLYALAGLAALAVLCILAMVIDATARRDLSRRIDEDLARRQEPVWDDDEWQ